VKAWHHVAGLALQAEPLKATPKAVAEDAIGLAIKSQVSNEIGLYALAHDAQSRRAPDQLPLAFGKTVAAAKVVSHALDKIAEPARRLATAVQAIDAKKFRPVRYGRSMRALTASYRRYSFCDFQRNVVPMLSAVSQIRDQRARRSGHII
jgi:hypothetical protein